MIDFESNYLTRNLITYIGNKRSLLSFIDTAVDEIKSDLGNEHPSVFDGFSGTGCVARLFKHYAGELYVNDLEAYSETVNRCYLANKNEIDVSKINNCIDMLNESKLARGDIGFIRKNYAPVDDNNIQPGERVFYTNKNAKIIDNIRVSIKEMVEPYNPEITSFVLAPLLVEASIHTNTSGVFKGFHKKDDIGHFGGAGENALFRIKTDIVLDYPVFCQHECPVKIIRGDINLVVKNIPEVDIAYYDPPYNQHPYGSNYFMLNIINDYDNPPIQDGVSGIAQNWNRSAYNKRNQAEDAMNKLIEDTKAKYVLISYNNEGIIPIDTFQTILSKYGTVSLRKKTYNTYRGAKNTGNGKKLLNGQERALTVEEMLWVLKKN